MLRRIFPAISIAIACVHASHAADNLNLDGLDRLEGFIDLYWDADSGLDNWISRQSPKATVMRAHYGFARFEIERLKRDPLQLELMVPVTVPPGSPIGSFQTSTH